MGALEVSVIRQFDLSIVTVRCFRASAASANIMSNVKEAMLQHVLSLARGGVIISPQFFVSCTGYQSASEFISRLLAGFSRHWPAKHPPTSTTTVAWYPDSALLTLEHVSPPEHLRDSVTEVFQLLVLKFGTVYRLHSWLRTWHLTVSNEDLRPICLHWCDETSAPSDYSWFLALYKYSLCVYVCMYV